MSPARMYGDWAGAGRRVRQLPDDAIAKLNLIVKAQAQWLLSQIKEAIDNQTLDLAPLSEEYLARKVAKGLSSKILIATHEYADNLRILEKGEKRDYKVFVGAIKGDRHNESGLDMATLAKYLERGTTRIPARPHISIIWEQNRDRIRRTIASELAKELSVRGL